MLHFQSIFAMLYCVWKALFLEESTELIKCNVKYISKENLYCFILFLVIKNKGLSENPEEHEKSSTDLKYAVPKNMLPKATTWKSCTVKPASSLYLLWRCAHVPSFVAVVTHFSTPHQQKMKAATLCWHCVLKPVTMVTRANALCTWAYDAGKQIAAVTY